ncbi:MAG: 2-dehydro-3-deoxy-D-gluconate 5-dehydrogenase KduD [Treponema sp.]|jgi:2-deoxy-D-gluconate 3-dehydrogenase|nr:2-dehydro-3-deoxy-D-gluconate 5-dehydrogenase KduD [Treponema sp.]
MGILDSFRLDGKTAIVTGCSRGLGQGISAGLAEAGADIFGVDYFPEAAETKTMVEKAGTRFAYFSANLLTIEPVEKIFAQAAEDFGHVDIVVNNAGIIKRNDAVDFTEAEWDDVININLKTVFFMCQAAARQFIKQKTGGKIINIASMLSYQGGIRVPSYTASKSGVKGITMLMANEWAKHGINANAIAPGYMATDNTAALRADQQRSEDILARIPLGRWGTPEDLAGAAVFLASAASDYINGFTLAVDGGWLAR